MRNILDKGAVLSMLRTRSATQASKAATPASGSFSHTLARRKLHDVYAASPADAVAVSAFGLGLAVEAAAGRPRRRGQGLPKQALSEAG